MDPAHVHSTLRKYQLADGLPVVFDLERSHGAWLHDALGGEEYLDAFTCFASWPVGYNHPGLSDPTFQRDLRLASTHNPSNSDLYTELMASFVEAFATRVTPAGFPHHFWVSGGSLAVENALKTAFDWKARKLGRTRWDDDVSDLVILHFREAFHGRSGYSLSVTNSDPLKVGLFPKFPWPRVLNPKLEFDSEGGIANDVAAAEAESCRQIEAAFQRHGKRIAAILIEPLQGEGGDNHFRTEFLRRLRQYADENEALLIFDEVQCGFFGSGRPWYWQHHDVRPDVVAFGKKTQVCGIYASARVDEVPQNVFALASRINSTWGGSLTDMVRGRRLIEIILDERLDQRVVAVGERFIDGLRELARGNEAVRNVRGAGSLAAFTLETPAQRDRVLEELRRRRLLALKSGASSIRFRLPFVLTDAEIDTMLSRIDAALPAAHATTA